MFLHQYKAYSNLLLAADSIAGLVAIYFSYYLRYYLVKFVPLEVSRYFNPELLPFREYLFYWSLFLPFWLALLIVTQRYSGLMRLPVRGQISRALQFILAVSVLMGFSIFTFKLVVSRPLFFSFLFLSGCLLISNRLVLQGVLRSRNINEHNQIKILIIGCDERACRVGQLLKSFKIWGYHVVGHISREGEHGPVSGGVRVLGTLRELPHLLQESVVADEIIFAGMRSKDFEELEGTIKLCEDLGIRTRVAANFLPFAASRVSLEFLENLPLITFSAVPDHQPAIIAKRVVDFLAASLLLILFAPLMVLTAALIKFTSPGPVFYRQLRCGLYGRKFRLTKFRTMIDGAEDQLWEIKHLNEMDGPVFKMRNDPRVTPLGRVLRKFSIDELPQLWNVIKGEMSIVGPRAPLPEEVRYYSVKQRRRLSVKPGITCLWQISGRSDIDFDRWMDLDLNYIDNWSFWLDMRIMLKTIPVVFTGRGAR
ncbi:MAG: sugar transferase [Acidobacteriota bacterium]